MKKILFTISILLLFCQVSYAAIDAAVDWDFQPGVGNNNNGGGFKQGATGTDYSTAVTPYIALTDAEVKGGVYTRVYSATANLNDSKLVGNIMCVVSGTSFTAGLYEITAVGTDGDDYMDIDRNCASGNSNDGVANIGGTRAVSTDAFFEQCVAGQDIWVKSGTMTLTENLAVGRDGATGNPIKIIGYKTSHGDTCDGTDRPLIVAAAYTTTWDNYWLLRNLMITTTAANGIFLGAEGNIENCKIENFSATGNYDAVYFDSGNYHKVYNNEIVCIKGYALRSSTNSSVLHKNNYFHSSVYGLYDNNSTNLALCTIYGNIFENLGTGIGSNTLAGSNIISNTFVKNGTSVTAAGSISIIINNNIFYKSTTEALTETTSNATDIVDYNDFYSNGSDATNFTKRTGNIALDPGFTFVAPAGTDDSGVADKATSMVDTSENFVTLGVTVGKTIYNTTDCSVGTITSITTTTNPNDTINFSGGLTNGTDNDFDNGDTYTITPGNYAVGANMKAAGFPGAFPGGGSTGYMDIGAVQREEQGGGEYSYGYAY